MRSTGFMRWHNLDATADVICLCCFQTIARTHSLSELLAEEDDHACNPVEDFMIPQPNPLHGLCR
jgi:hypothetical protein